MLSMASLGLPMMLSLRRLRLRGLIIHQSIYSSFFPSFVCCPRQLDKVAGNTQLLINCCSHSYICMKHSPLPLCLYCRHPIIRFIFPTNKLCNLYETIHNKDSDIHGTLIKASRLLLLGGPVSTMHDLFCF